MTKAKFSEIKFGEIAEFKNGLNFSAADYGAGTKIIGVADFKDYSVPRYGELSQVRLDVSSKKDMYLKDGDIVFVRSNGNKELVGRSMAIRNPSERVSFSGFVIRARPNTNLINPVFLSYFCKSDDFRRRVANAAGGSNIQNLSQPLLAGCPIPYPGRPKQDKIAEVLSVYDDLIEANSRRIKLLEEMAQITYEEWFVRLRFPGHEITPMNSETGLPVGWKQSTLQDLCTLTMGQSPKSEFYNTVGDGLPFHQGVKDYGDRFPKNASWSTEGTRFAFEDDILFSVRAPVGRINISLEKIILGRGLAAIRHKGNAQGFLYCALKKQFFEEDMMGSGAIFASVTKNDMLKIKFVDPDLQSLSRFTEIIHPIDNQIKNLHRQNAFLNEARDLLLPRFMAGMVDIDEYLTRQTPIKGAA